MITLTYPDAAVELPVRTPPVETVTLRVNARRSMNNTMYSHAHPSNKTRFDFTVDGIDENVLHQVTDLIKTRIGQLCILTDSDNQKWRGQIINTPINGTESGPNSSVVLTFIGDLVT